MKQSIEVSRELLKTTINRLFYEGSVRHFSKSHLLYLVNDDDALLDALTTEWVNFGYLKRLKSFKEAQEDENFLELITYIEVDPRNI